MPSPSWEDLTEFFADDSDGGFAIEANIQLAAGSFRTINVIYDEPFIQTDIPDGGFVRGADIYFTAVEADVRDVEDNDVVQVNGESLYIKSIKPDGTGMARVYLTRYKKSPLDKPGSRL